MHDFEYEAPTTLAAAIELLTRENGSARPLAGGTDLIDQVRVGRLKPDLLVDVKKIAELNRLEVTADGLHLGAAVSCARIAAHDAIREQYSALWDSSQIIGGVQIQQRASMGGNLCNSGPAADTTPAAIALGGVCVISGPNGTREVPVEEFCTGPSQNVLTTGELLVELKFPKPAPHSGSHYRRFIPRNEMDIAVVGVGASVTLDEKHNTVVAAKIGLGAVAAHPLVAVDAAQLLIGKSPDDELLKAVGAAAREIAAPIDDMRSPRDYRIHLVGVLVERVLKAAITRARGEPFEYRPGS